MHRFLFQTLGKSGNSSKHQGFPLVLPRVRPFGGIASKWGGGELMHQLLAVATSHSEAIRVLLKQAECLGPCMSQNEVPRLTGSCLVHWLGRWGSHLSVSHPPLFFRELGESR